MVPYKATSRKQIVNAINSYTQEVTVLAPSVWDPEARLEPPDNLPSVVKRYKKYMYFISQLGEILSKCVFKLLNMACTPSFSQYIY